MRRIAGLSIAVIAMACTGNRRNGSASETRISGQVLSSDSAPVHGATIVAVNTEGKGDRTLTTGEEGRFIFHSLDAGRYILAITTPRLDTLGFSIEDTVVVAAAEKKTITLRIPSARALAERSCGPKGGGAVIGQVLDSMKRGAPNARLIVRWVNTTADSAMGLLSAVTDSGGRYVVCHVPSGPGVLVKATIDGHQSQSALVRLADSALGTYSPALLPQRPQDSVETRVLPDSILPRATLDSTVTAVMIKGVVRTESGSPISGARVVIEGKETIGGTTDANGHFVISNVPVGEHTIIARAIRYKSQRVTTPAQAHEVWNVTIVMGANVLAPVVVTAEQTMLDDIGFSGRKQRHPDAYHFSREDLDVLGAKTITDVLQPLKEVKVHFAGQMAETITGLGRNGVCWWVDGRRFESMFVPPEQNGMRESDINEQFLELKRFYPVEEMFAMEIFPPGTGESRYSTDTCVAVLIWTKQYVEERAKSKEKKKK